MIMGFIFLWAANQPSAENEQLTQQYGQMILLCMGPIFKMDVLIEDNDSIEGKLKLFQSEKQILGLSFESKSFSRTLRLSANPSGRMANTVTCSAHFQIEPDVTYSLTLNLSSKGAPPTPEEAFRRVISLFWAPGLDLDAMLGDVEAIQWKVNNLTFVQPLARFDLQGIGGKFSMQNPYVPAKRNTVQFSVTIDESRWIILYQWDLDKTISLPDPVQLDIAD